MPAIQALAKEFRLLLASIMQLTKGEEERVSRAN
jgi:hypothetical protein